MSTQSQVFTHLFLPVPPDWGWLGVSKRQLPDLNVISSPVHHPQIPNSCLAAQHNGLFLSTGRKKKWEPFQVIILCFVSSPLISWSSFGILLGFTLYGCLKPNEFGLHWDKQAFVPKFVCGIWYVLMGVHLLIGRIFSEARQNLLEKLSRCQLWPELGPAPFCPLPFRNLPVLHKAVLCTTKTGSVDVIPGPLRR